MTDTTNVPLHYWVEVGTGLCGECGHARGWPHRIGDYGTHTPPMCSNLLVALFDDYKEGETMTTDTRLDKGTVRKEIETFVAEDTDERGKFRITLSTGREIEFGEEHECSFYEDGFYVIDYTGGGNYFVPYASIVLCEFWV